MTADRHPRPAQIDVEAAQTASTCCAPVPEDQLDASVVTAYENLSRVERDFRSIKSDDLDLRPLSTACRTRQGARADLHARRLPHLAPAQSLSAIDLHRPGPALAGQHGRHRPPPAADRAKAATSPTPPAVPTAALWPARLPGHPDRQPRCSLARASLCLCSPSSPPLSGKPSTSWRTDPAHLEVAQQNPARTAKHQARAGTVSRISRNFGIRSSTWQATIGSSWSSSRPSR